MVDDKLKSRKLWVCVGTALGATVLLLLGKLSEANWLIVVSGTVIAYQAAQGFTDALNR